MNEIKHMYIFIREDLSPTYQIIQAAHATHEAGLKFGGDSQSTHFVLIGAKDEKHLHEISMFLNIHEIPFEMFHEPDYNTGHTAIATKPLSESQRRPFRKFQILKE